MFVCFMYNIYLFHVQKNTKSDHLRLGEIWVVDEIAVELSEMALRSAVARKRTDID